MRNTNKRLPVLLAGAVLLAMLAACGGNGHTHTPAEGWMGDLKQHWKTCQCGELLEKGNHELKDGVQCTLCLGEVIDFGESGGQFVTYDAQGRLLQCLSYGADGSREFAQLYAYGDNGHMTETEYTAEVLTAKREYHVDGEGIQILLSDIAYQEDGSYTVYQYDLHGNETLEGSYTADGKAESETRYENEY
ncbi:MAG: hypothetical protein IKK17_04305, partial [Oscillospiraceae bacterium]|nr:hypothetical protein [Oscillospiraceae bacterium]